MKKVQFFVGKDTLIGCIFTPKIIKKKYQGVLIVHGLTSQQNRGFHLARALAKKGNIVMTFDLRGHGGSDGNIKKIAPKDSLEDVVAAYDFLSKIKEVNTNNIIVVGSSYGGYLAPLLSTQRKAKSLILRVPANYQDQSFNKAHSVSRKNIAREKWKLQLHGHTKTKSLRALHKFRGKVLIVESEKDEVVPSVMVKSYVNAVVHKNKLSYKIMERAPHSISSHPVFQRQFRDVVLEWLK